MGNTKKNSNLSFFNGDQMFIGEISKTPAVGKLFAKRKDYLVAVQQVRESGEFLGLTNENGSLTTLNLLAAQTEVDIVERENCVFLSVWLKGRKVTTGFFGLTDTKGLGFYSFLEGYRQNPSILISLICNETNEETFVLGIKKVNLNTLP